MTAAELAAIATAALFIKIYPSENSAVFALLAAMTIDYITGVVVAIARKKLSSGVGFKGLCKKMLIICIITVCYIIDNYVIDSNTLTPVVSSFYLANECISILENSAKLGVPIPKKILEIFAQLRGDKK